MSEVVAWKLGSAALLAACGVLGGLAPWWFGLRPSGARWLGLGSAFAGGVLLGAGLIHLLGDAIEGFGHLLPDATFPWATSLAGASFFAVLFIERVAPRVARVPVGSDPGDEVDQVLEAMDESSTYPYLLLLTLSVHSLIAGLALGAQASLAGFAVVFIAVIAHKGAAGFALGASLHRAGVPRPRALRLIVGFAVMTPLGVLLGTGASELLASRSATLFEAVFDAVAGGTFLYIATFDVIREEFLPPPPDRASKWFAAVVGLALMAWLALWV